MEKDNEFMKRAIELARQGRGRTSPNLMSGAVVVKDEQIVGEGFYSSNGSEHAEFNALKAAEGKTEGATLYVVVEPCSSKGRNLSCGELIQQKGIKRVVIAMEDPNPTLKGKGIRSLFEAKLEVSLGTEAISAQKLNETLSKHASTKIPFVNLLTAMTLDGKVATVLGDRDWIISDLSHRYIHELRASYDAVLVGVNTIIRDNPQLSCKITGGRDPLKIIVDSYAKTPINSKIFIKNNNEDYKANVIIAVSKEAPEDRIRLLQTAGAEILFCESDKEENIMENRINLNKLIQQIGKKGITSILVESGGTINASVLESGVADKVTFLVSPKILGGRNALTPVEGDGISFISEALEVENIEYKRIGNDLLIEGYLHQ